MLTKEQIDAFERDGFLNAGRALTDDEVEHLSASMPVRFVPCPVRRGEVHFHHSLTWHGSPANRSPHRRRALAIHYMSSDATHTGRPHAMSPFIKVPVGGRMLDAGDHFPVVYSHGTLVSP
jgi:ectoine hydroxylase-related dioxygenase (phytanoyl-CoA dioxygenase family)